jgi:hypothetical protein
MTFECLKEQRLDGRGIGHITLHPCIFSVEYPLWYALHPLVVFPYMHAKGIGFKAFGEIRLRPASLDPDAIRSLGTFNQSDRRVRARTESNP